MEVCQVNVSIVKVKCWTKYILDTPDQYVVHPQTAALWRWIAGRCSMSNLSKGRVRVVRNIYDPAQLIHKEALEKKTIYLIYEQISSHMHLTICIAQNLEEEMFVGAHCFMTHSFKRATFKIKIVNNLHRILSSQGSGLQSVNLAKPAAARQKCEFCCDIFNSLC